MVPRIPRDQIRLVTQTKSTAGRNDKETLLFHTFIARNKTRRSAFYAEKNNWNARSSRVWAKTIVWSQLLDVKASPFEAQQNKQEFNGSILRKLWNFILQYWLNLSVCTIHILDTSVHILDMAPPLHWWCLVQVKPNLFVWINPVRIMYRVFPFEQTAQWWSFVWSCLTLKFPWQERKHNSDIFVCFRNFVRRKVGWNLIEVMLFRRRWELFFSRRLKVFVNIWLL